MKPLLLFTTLFPALSFGQNAEIAAFQEVVIESQIMGYRGEVKVSDRVDSAMLWNHLIKLKNLPLEDGKVTLNLQNKKGDSVVVTREEIEGILDFFENPENLKFETSTNPERIIDLEEIQNHLRKNREDQVVLITKPYFFRDGNLAVAFFTDFCCGGNYGFVNLSLYTRKNTTAPWIKTYDFSSGAW